MRCSRSTRIAVVIVLTGGFLSVGGPVRAGCDQTDGVAWFVRPPGDGFVSIVDCPGRAGAFLRWMGVRVGPGRGRSRPPSTSLGRAYRFHIEAPGPSRVAWRVFRPTSGSLAWAEVPPGQHLYLPGRNRFADVEPGWFPVDTRDERWSREMIDRGVVLTARPACAASTFRITLADVGGAGGRSTLACDLGDAARWLMAVPSAATVARPSGDLGSGYLLTFEDVSSPHARWLLTELVFPLAAGGSAAFVPETGTAGSGGTRWTVGTGWRWIPAGVPIPASLARLGMPEPRVIAPPRPHADPVTATFLLLVAVSAALAVRRRVVARRPQPA